MAKRKRKQKLAPRYFKWRGGRPRMEPGPALRELGIAGVDLKDAAGRFLALGPAVERAKQILDEWDARRRGETPPAAGLPRAPRTVSALWRKFSGEGDLASAAPEFARLRLSTRRDYINKARVFLAEIGASPAVAVRRAHLKALWRELYEMRGHAMANGVLAVCRLTFSYGEDIEWIAAGTNPAVRLRLPQLGERTAIWTPEQAALIVAAADAVGRPSVGDAFVLALHQGQRPADIIALPDRIAVIGRMDVRQSKRGKLVSVKLTAKSAERARAALARKAGDDGEVAEIGGALLIDEETGRPYRDSNQLGKRFRKVRAAAAAELVMQDREGEAYALMGKIFYDARGTYLTRAHRAKVDAYGRAAVSGHSRRTQVQNEEHYVAGGEDLADAAQDAYSEWMKAEGIEI